MLIRALRKAKLISGAPSLISRFRTGRVGVRFVYALTPPPRLANIGDQAQVVAIRAWLDNHFPDIPVIEIDKDNVLGHRRLLPRLIRRTDIFILHSGGNLGDRGMWSESARRFIISTFPHNKIVSLPQTIFFSDTPTGREERATTAEIYGQHPDLTVYGRDRVSGLLAQELFPKATTGVAPDFVLSLPEDAAASPTGRRRLLLCLRLDDESALTDAERTSLAQSGWDTTVFDTTLPDPIKRNQRAKVVSDTRDLFRDADVVITDRFHGLIFSVISARPCIVLRTVDHKLTSAMEWFKDVEFVRFADSPVNAISFLPTMEDVSNFWRPDWNKLYFDAIATSVYPDGGR